MTVTLAPFWWTNEISYPEERWIFLEGIKSDCCKNLSLFALCVSGSRSQNLQNQKPQKHMVNITSDKCLHLINHQFFFH
jgi:hypothetical protein